MEKGIKKEDLIANGFKEVGASLRKSLSDNLELCIYASEGFIRFQTKGAGFTNPMKNLSEDSLMKLIRG